jgi:diaminohydroxyphosphoribosylaminopyrimidine deaminase / 5-amino-6-(5-phosphoribosylamino)uracil reductase
MRRALDLARRGWGHTAPNPMVGAVLVRDGAIVGEGYHAEFGGDHAEVRALRAAGAEAEGATAYVTLEPCTHTGHTPPCVEALIRARVSRVVVAVRDPHPVARGGIDRLTAAGVATTVGVEEGAARELNAPFFHTLQSDRPWVTLKLAVSLDGAVADGSGTRGRLTGDVAQQEVHRLRAGHDAVAVGIGTVLADDPLLTVRHADPPRTPPLRVVFDRQARLPLASQLVRSAAEAPVVVVTATPDQLRSAQLAAAGALVLVAPTIGDALVQLRERGVRSLLLEGGPRLAGSFVSASAVDRLIIFQAPVILGARALPALGFTPEATLTTARHLGVIERRLVGDDVMTIYAFPGS